MGAGSDWLERMDGDELRQRLREAAYAAVGLGVLGFQWLQVGRRDLSRQLQPQVRDAAATLQRLAAAADEAVNPVLDRFEQGLPDETRDLVRAARTAAVRARDSVLQKAGGER